MRESIQVISLIFGIAGIFCVAEYVSNPVYAAIYMLLIISGVGVIHGILS